MSELNPNPAPETRYEDSRAKRQSIFWPLFLIAAGVVFLLHNMGLLSVLSWSFILSLWPVLLIVGGLDGLWKGEGIAGSLFWLGIGVIFLIANLGYLPFNVWSFLWRFWPILLVVIGLDIIIGRRPGVWAQVIAVILALALLGGLVWYAATQPVFHSASPLSSETISEPLQGATSARVDINMMAGRLTITGGAEPGYLVEGRVDMPRSDLPAKEASVQNGEAYFHLHEEGAVIPGEGGNRNSWDLKLNGSIPTHLKLNLGAGESFVDLTGVKINGLDLQMGAGQTTVTLPKEGSFNARMNGGVGELVLRVPRGLAVEIQANRALTGIDVAGSFTSDGSRFTSGANPTARVDLTLPVGSIRLEMIP